MTEGFTDVPSFLLQGKDPERVALEFLEGAVTYGELRDLVDRAASALIAAGGEKGDRILVVDENSVLWVAAYLGTMRAGRVAVPLPPGTSGDALTQVSRATGAKIAFASRTVAGREQVGFRGLDVRTAIPKSAPLQSYPPVDAGDLAALMFTSGSTSEPRGVMISHGNIIANTGSIIASLGLVPSDRMMTVLPFHYCFGTSLLHTHLRIGGTLVIDSRFMYPEVVLQRMSDAGCTGFAGVPSHFQILLRRSSLATRALSGLRYVQQAGGRLAPADVAELRRALPDTDIFLMYGQTEATARLSVLPPDLVDRKPGSIGKAVPGVRLRVVDGSGAEVRPGDIGEIVAEGENIAPGYWRASEESSRVFRDGCLYTGDLATVDGDGCIYVVDRDRDFLKVRGERVSSRQIEDELLAFGELVEAAVVGIPDEVLGESVKVFVVPRSQDSEGIEGRLLLYSKRHLPPQLVPREIVVLPELPRNGAGKVIKSRLRNPQPASTASVAGSLR